MEPERGDSFFGTWIRSSGLRAAVAAGFGGTRAADGGEPDTTDRSALWSAELAGSIAILDPRILALDYSAGIQSTASNTAGSMVDNRNAVRLTNVGLSASLLSGRSLPLRVFANRAAVDTTTDQAYQGFDETSRDATGTRSSVGVDWEVQAPRFPRIKFSAVQDVDAQVRNFLFGQSQSSDLRRVEARVNDDHPTFGYDATYRLDDYTLSIPEAALHTQTSQRFLTGAFHYEPSPMWRVDLGGRASQYRLGRNENAGQTSGLGLDAAARFAPNDRIFTAVRYSMSTNLSEAILSGRVDLSEAGVEGAANIAVSNRVATDDFEARAGYVKPSGSVEVFAHTFSLGVPLFGPITLSRQRTVGATVRGERPLAGFQFSGSLEAEFGTAFSTRGYSEPFRAGSVQLALSRQLGRTLRLSLDGSTQRSSRLSFYVVPLETSQGGARLETLLPAWARLSMTARWSSVVRDAISHDFNDRFLTWGLAAAGPRYGISFDVNSTDARMFLLSPDLLTRRTDLALILGRDPGLLGSYMASTMRSEQLNAFVEPWPRLRILASKQRQSLRNIGLYDQHAEGDQLALVYALRQIQLEAGWSRYSTSTTLASGSYINQRYFVRVRRDITIF